MFVHNRNYEERVFVNQPYDPVRENLCGEKRIMLRGKDESLWTNVGNVIQNVDGEILFLICSDDLVIPWAAIETIQPLGR